VTATAADTRACWCGNAALDPFDDDYGHCSVCETLVRLHVPADIDQVRSDDDDFYGRDYWFRHQVDDLGAFDVVERARRDLPERCAFWTAALLRRTASPARALDVGCGHGGFVAFLRSLGFDATGLELSPSVVEFARATFGVPVEVGRLEERLEITSSTIDLLVLMDVLEHLPDPMTTMRRAADVIRPTGLMFFQTPRYPEGATLAELKVRDDLFLRMLVPEHLYLFSRSSVQRLLHEVGIGNVEFDDPLAEHDMMGFAARTAIPHAARADTDHLLESSTAARFTAAVLDANSRVSTELASLRDAQEGAEIYATDLRAALTRTEAAAARHADSLSAIIAARDVEITALKKLIAERS
jgi:2-polyprenyl-3-methyl-5-hydroxy-6-metoxy-1,4-benzoquinol methylase